MTSTPAAVATTNYTAITISLGVIFIVGAVIAVVVASYYRLQRHRADAVAMAAYRSSPRMPSPTSRSCAPS